MSISNQSKYRIIIRSYQRGTTRVEKKRMKKSRAPNSTFTCIDKCVKILYRWYIWENATMLQYTENRVQNTFDF